MTRRSFALFVTCLLPLGLASGVHAQTRPAATAAQHEGADAWRQLGGPHRNFRVDSAAVATAWGAGGPTRLWSRPLGEGYSSILADGDLLVTMYRRDDDEVIIALDAATGATRWEYAYAAPLVHNGYFDVWLNSAGPGPYSTPLIAGDTVFAVGVDGRLHALDKRTGELRWAHDLVAAFEIAEYNAFASSPIAYGRTVILPLGGSGNGVVAFDRETGATLWRSPALDLAPGSPVLIEVDGQDQLVVVGQQELVGLDPRDGRRLWSHPHTNELGLNISMPVWSGDNALFLSSGYDGGSRLIRLSRIDGRTTSEGVWSNNRMRVHFGNALHMDGLLLASTGDFGPAFLAALDAETGAEVWRERTFARAQLLDADGLLVILDEDGELAVASVTLDGLQVHARAPVLTANAWTPPTLAGSTLYVRDRQRILALDLGEASAAAAEPR
ncbi:MAG: PQQ-like beta-propeller repeat protein [Acidobacteria bacterium]|nr:PQQ-like beta-propeller repeat protein [Acidobacteriota bacterium]